MDIIINNEASLAVLPGINALVTSSPKARPTQPIEKVDGSSVFAPWGYDNLFTQGVIEDCEKNPILGSTLVWKAKAMYSEGIVYGKIEPDPDGNDIFKRLNDPEIESFMRRSNISRYGIESAIDLYYFYNVFPEIILSNDRKKIVSISTHDASYCRWGLQNSKGLIEQCYINANWSNGGTIKDSIRVPVLDVYLDASNKLKARTDSFKYIYPISFPSPGKTYYQLAPWNAIRSSGWLELANSIPKFKKAIMENQISIKYHIEVSDLWWEWKFPKWRTMTDQEKVDAKTAEFKTFQDFVSGKDNAGKFLLSTFKTDPVSGKEYAGWKITAIDDKVKDGMYLEDGKEAGANIISALGVDNTLISTPGDGMGGGSGSDKLVAYQVYNALNKVEADIVLEPLTFISEYNGWLDRIPGLTWAFKNNLSTAQQQVKPMRQLQPNK